MQQKELVGPSSRGVFYGDSDRDFDKFGRQCCILLSLHPPATIHLAHLRYVFSPHLFFALRRGGGELPGPSILEMSDSLAHQT